MNLDDIFLADENYSRGIVRGWQERVPEVRLIHAQDVRLTATDDRIILDYAAQNDYIVLSHDYKTMIRFALERVERGLPMPGLVMSPNRHQPMGKVIDSLVYLYQNQSRDWFANQVIFLPL